MNSHHTQGESVAERLDAIRPSSLKRRLQDRVQLFLADRKLVRYGLVSLNVVLLIAIAWFTLGPTYQGQPLGRQGIIAPAGNAATEPLDQLSSADIAEQAAIAAGLAPEITLGVINQADSVHSELAFAPADTAVIAKPLFVPTPFKSRNDIKDYVVANGDTVSSIAAKFGVTSESIMGSNSLRGNVVPPGLTLLIPPIDGIVYTVLTGDNVDSLAQKFRADKNLILAFNDIELTGLQLGDRILIPNGRQPSPSILFSGASNGYIPGWCTWYAASRAGVPPNWGNANTWDTSAQSAGWIVSRVPIKGAVAQTDSMSALGHVGVVDEVSADGTMIKYSDMNGLAGFNRVGHSGWVSASLFQNYIYR